ncbi:MAG: histidine phosphatase family protein [Rhodospirillales bacterium]
MHRKVVLTLLIAVFGFSWGSPPIAAQEVIFVVRHASPPELLSMDQIKDDTPLSESGHKRAEDLASSLKDAGITAIYATDTLRTVQTAKPIAKQLGLPIRQVSRNDIQGLVTRLRADHAKDRVLVINHWNTLPPTLKALGHPVNVKIQRTARDEIFVVVPIANKPPAVIHLRY